MEAIATKSTPQVSTHSAKISRRGNSRAMIHSDRETKPSTIHTTTMSKGFQVTLPSAIRKKLNLEAGDPIDFVQDGNLIVIKKAKTRKERIMSVFAEIDRINAKYGKHITPEQKAFREKTHGWTATQLREYIDNLPETKARAKEKYGL